MRLFDLSAIQPPVGDTWEEAKAEKNWLAYRLVDQGEKKPKKVPQSPSGRNVAPKAAACLTFDEACHLASRLGPDCGIGYLPRAGSAMVCVDFDGVLENGLVVQPDLQSFTSYAERSPSGTGLHVLVTRPADIEPVTFDDGEDWVGFIVSDSKFFTVSMDRWGENTEITDDTGLVTWVFQRERPAIEGGKRAYKPQMGQERREELRKLHLGDEKLLWFNRLSPTAREKCAAEMLAALPRKYARAYDTWVRVGMALKLSDDGWGLFEVWDNWSSTAPNYDGQMEAKWDSFSPIMDDRGVSATIRTVITWAKQNGWDATPWEHAAEAQDFKRLENAFSKFSPAAQSAEIFSTVLSGQSGSLVENIDNLATGCPEHLTRPGGLVEALIEYGAARSPRETRLPALAGALAATSALTDRHYIIETPGFLTSTGLQVVLVSETGTGKETARDVVYAVCGLRGTLALADSYASAPALHLALTKTPTQLWANDEFGRYLKVAANANGAGAHDFALITMAMKLHTMFDKFLPEKVYSQGSDRARVDHPLLVAMHTTTPKALFDAMDADTVVDGMLGRLLVIQQNGRPPLRPLGSKGTDPLPSIVRERINRQGNYIRQVSLARLDLSAGEDLHPIATSLAPIQWLPGQKNHRSIAISAGDDVLEYFESIRMECERRAGSNGVAAALWSRAYEQILRLAGVIAFGDAVWDENLGNPTIQVHNLFWARDLVYWCLEQLVPAAEEHASDGERDALQKAIMANIRKLGVKAGSGGWVRNQDLLALLKGRGRSYRDLKEEVTALIECGDIEVQVDDDGVPVRPAMLRLSV